MTFSTENENSTKSSASNRNHSETLLGYSGDGSDARTLIPKTFGNHHFRNISATKNPSLDSGGKPSTLFPPGRLVKLLVDRTNAEFRQSFVAELLSNKVHHFKNVLAEKSCHPDDTFHRKLKFHKVIRQPPESLRNIPAVSRRCIRPPDFDSQDIWKSSFS